MKIFYLPDLGEGLAEAEIREWYIKEGDIVKIDEPIASMETAKAIVDVPSPYNGKILKLYGKKNEVIKTGAAFVGFDLEDELKEKGSVVGSLEESSNSLQEETMIIGSSLSKKETIKAMPAARILAREMNIDLNIIKGSGPKGLITVEDVKKNIKLNVGTVQVSSIDLGDNTEKLHGVRRVMAQAMIQSHRDIVPVTLFEDAFISHLSTNADITVKLMQAMVQAVQIEPSLNAWFEGNSLSQKIFENVNIGMAVDTPFGLFVPVIKQVELLSADVLRKLINEQKTKVMDRSISNKDMQGATITLSNFGTIAGKYATPIIIPPMVAILGCGRFREVPIIKAGEIIKGKMLPLSLTFDHRAVTGGEASRFLGAFIKHLESESALTV